MQAIRTEDPMPTATCHCAAIRIELDAPPPYLNECRCSLCRRYGVRWGYYRPGQVRLLAEPGATQAYAWGGANLDFHRCRTCGCLTHWTARSGGDRMGVNGNLLAPADLAFVPLRRSAGPR
jgi:hypothetical protein